MFSPKMMYQVPISSAASFGGRWLWVPDSQPSMRNKSLLASPVSGCFIFILKLVGKRRGAIAEKMQHVSCTIGSGQALREVLQDIID